MTLLIRPVVAATLAIQIPIHRNGANHCGPDFEPLDRSFEMELVADILNPPDDSRRTTHIKSNNKNTEIKTANIPENTKVIQARTR